jgi:hypothetical protein
MRVMTSPISLFFFTAATCGSPPSARSRPCVLSCHVAVRGREGASEISSAPRPARCRSADSNHLLPSCLSAAFLATSSPGQVQVMILYGRLSNPAACRVPRYTSRSCLTVSTPPLYTRLKSKIRLKVGEELPRAELFFSAPMWS